MSNKDLHGQKDWGKIIRAALMVSIYLIMSILIAFTNLFDNLFKNHYGLRIGFAILFLVYGVFRGWRFWRDAREK